MPATVKAFLYRKEKFIHSFRKQYCGDGGDGGGVKTYTRQTDDPRNKPHVDDASQLKQEEVLNPIDDGFGDKKKDCAVFAVLGPEVSFMPTN